MSRSFKLFLVVLFVTLAWGIFGPRIPGGSHSRMDVARMEIANFETAINEFRADCGYYPKSPHLGIHSPGFGGVEGTDVLIKRPVGIPQGVNWHGPYLDARKLPNDPWGRPYVYECPGKHNTNGFDVYSLGRNGKGGEEAIDNWTTP